MGIFGGLGPIASDPLIWVETAVAATAPAPSALSAPQQNRQGAYRSWDTFREYWGSSAPAQAGLLSIVRDRFRGIG